MGNRFCLIFLKVFKGDVMKILSKAEIVVKLKERIMEAKEKKSETAEQLQKLLDTILKSGYYNAF